MKVSKFFRMVHKHLEENNLLPPIIDYGNCRHDDVELEGIDWNPVGIVDFGGSEGIYLVLYADYGRRRVPIGTYKTLADNKEAYQQMSLLNVEFVFAARDFQWQHRKEFE